MEKPHPITSLRTRNVITLVRQGATRPGLSSIWAWAGPEVAGMGLARLEATVQRHRYLHYRNR